MLQRSWGVLFPENQNSSDPGKLMYKKGQKQGACMNQVNVLKIWNIKKKKKLLIINIIQQIDIWKHTWKPQTHCSVIVTASGSCYQGQTWSITGVCDVSLFHYFTTTVLFHNFLHRCFLYLWHSAGFQSLQPWSITTGIKPQRNHLTVINFIKGRFTLMRNNGNI